MEKKYQPYIPQTADELMDMLGGMILSSPTFEDDLGYFPGQDINTEFYALNEGLKNLRQGLGEARYHELVAMSDRMRAHFEADPEDKTEDAIQGRNIIMDMQDMIMKCREVWRFDD
jgi:hypothetical protein